MRRLQLFGHPHLRTEVSNAPVGASPKAIALLALLAEGPSRPHSRERLAETLWPDAPLDEARSNLRRHLHILSRLLGTDCFTISRSTAQWSPQAPVELDVVLFSAAEMHEPDRAASLYNGDLCETIDHPALDAPRARLRTRYETLVRRSAERSRAAGGARFAQWLERVLAIDPLDESATRELMRLYAARGDTTHAIRLYNGLAHRLRAELQVEPQEETKALQLSLVHADAPQRGDVPLAPRTFVGRERELEQLAALFARSRCVTICGIGGIGKTTLAQRYAAQRSAYFVEASGAQDADALWQRLARAFDLPHGSDPARAISARLSGAAAPAIVLDACETSMEASAAVARLLLDGSGAQLLLTSRAPLPLKGETLVLEPFDVPSTDVQTPDALLRYPAYRLFVERAVAGNAAFRVRSSDVPAIVELLSRIDGIPLAIELLALRTRALSVSELLASYTSSRGARLDAAIAWAHRSLSSRERRILESLAVFEGAFSARAAETVCGVEREHLEALVSRGLVRARHLASEVRYDLLDTIREFVQKRSRASESSRAHASYFAALADEYATHFSSAQEIAYFRSTDDDERNFRSAIYWTFENDRPLCARIVAALCPYYVYRADVRWIDAIACELLGEFEDLILTCGIFAKARVLRERAATQLRAAREMFRARGDKAREIRALHNLAISVFNARQINAVSLFEELLDLQRSYGDEFGAAHTLVNIAASIIAESRFEEALALQYEGLRLFERIQYTRGAALTYEAIARSLFSLGRLEEAYDAARASIALLELVNDRVWLCQALRTLAAQCVSTKRRAEALQTIVRALEMLEQIENPIFQSNVCFTAFDVALFIGDAVGGALAYGKAVALHRTMQLSLIPDFQAYIEELVVRAARSIGKTAFDALAAEGERVDYAALASRLRCGSAMVSSSA